VLDLRELTFMDSSGVHLIMGVAGEARSGDGWLLVVRGSAQVERLLTLTGVRAQVLIFDLNAVDQAPSLRLAPPCTIA
jgi:anti-anti-sigma factor